MGGRRRSHPPPIPSPQGGGDAQRRGWRKPLGRMCAFHGQMGMYVRALAYMLSHGTRRHAAGVARMRCSTPTTCAPRSSDLMSLPFGDRPCMHEVLFDDHWLEGTGVTTLDFAKAMIDEGFHPMTVYFPLVVHGAMLIEPTESESKQSLDQFIASLRGLAEAAKARRCARASRMRRALPRGGGWTRPRRRASRGSGGRRRQERRRGGGVGRGSQAARAGHVYTASVTTVQLTQLWSVPGR